MRGMCPCLKKKLPIFPKQLLTGVTGCSALSSLHKSLTIKADVMIFVIGQSARSRFP